MLQMARTGVTKVFLAAWFIVLQTANGLIGYDCSGSSLNITSYSLLNVAQCNLPYIEPNSTLVNLELMQLNKYRRVQVDECRLEIERTIHYCGMYSHVSTVHNYHREYLVHLEEHQCRNLHNSNSLQIAYNVGLDALVKNITNSRTVTLAGKSTVDGSCKGAQYSDPFGTWDDVVVNAITRVHYTSYFTTVELESNKVTLQSGAKCDFLTGSCMDSSGTQAFWSVKPVDDCKFSKYTTLYRGAATRIEPHDKDPATYIVTTPEFTFSLEQRSRGSTCGYALIQTEIPKLFIMESAPGSTFPTNKIIDTENVDLMQYVNAKIVYVESHVRNQIKKLYHHIRINQCEAQRVSLMNALTTASFAPDMFAYNLMKGPGFHAVVTGESVSMIRCTPVPVTLRKTRGCFLEIHVTYNNESYFLAGMSRMLLRRGSAVDCHSAIPTVFFINGNWYALNPDFLRAPAPLTFHPTKEIEWEYERIKNLATTGIYSDVDLQKLRDRVLTKAETPSIIRDVARAANGEDLPPGTISTKYWIDKQMIKDMAELTMQTAWKGLQRFGNIVSILIGIVTIIQVIIGIINVFIHGYTLHDLFGCSFRILGAICGSITHCLIYTARKNANTDPAEERERDRQQSYTPLRSFRKPREESTSLSSVTPEMHASIDPLLLSKARSTLKAP